MPSSAGNKNTDAYDYYIAHLITIQHSRSRFPSPAFSLVLIYLSLYLTLPGPHVLETTT